MTSTMTSKGHSATSTKGQGVMAGGAISTALANSTTTVVLGDWRRVYSRWQFLGFSASACIRERKLLTDKYL